MGSAIAAIDGRSTVEELYRADSERLWRALYAFAGDADIASDAVAEAYAQLIKRGDKVRDPQAWIWRVAFRISSGALKTKREDMSRRGRTEEVLDRYTDPDLLAALAQLPASQRAAVILFYFADLPIRDIARRLGTNSLAVRANLSRGRRRLRELLGERDG